MIRCDVIKTRFLQIIFTCYVKWCNEFSFFFFSKTLHIFCLIRGMKISTDILRFNLKEQQ